MVEEFKEVQTGADEVLSYDIARKAHVRRAVKRTFAKAATSTVEPGLLADFHAPIDVDGGSQWYMDEQKARTKGPVPPLVHKVLIINVRKAEAAWWPRFFVGHPTIVRRDFPFMADDDR